MIKLIKNDPMKKEIKKINRIRKQKAKNMSTYEKIVTYPLQYEEKLLKKYITILSERNKDVDQLLHNIHKENKLKFSLFGNMSNLPVSLLLGKKIWNDIKINEAIGLEVVKTPHFVVSHIKHSPDDHISRKEIKIPLDYYEVPVTFDMLSNGNFNNLENNKDFLELSSSIAVQKTESSIIESLISRALIKEEFENIVSTDLEKIFATIKNKTHIEQSKVYLIVNKNTLKKLPTEYALNTFDYEVKIVETDSIKNKDILVTTVSKGNDHSIKTYLYDFGLSLEYENPKTSNIPSVIIGKRFECVVFSEFSFAYIKIK